MIARSAATKQSTSHERPAFPESRRFARDDGDGAVCANASAQREDRLSAHVGADGWANGSTCGLKPARAARIPGSAPVFRSIELTGFLALDRRLVAATQIT